MANGIGTGDPHGFNKGLSSKFREGSPVRQTADEARRSYQPKRSANKYEDEDNSSKTLNDKNHQGSSQKFRQLSCVIVGIFIRVYIVVVYLEGFVQRRWFWLYISTSTFIFIFLFFIYIYIVIHRQFRCITTLQCG